MVLLLLLSAAPLVAPAYAGVDASKVEYYEPLSSITLISLSSTTSGTGTIVSAVFSNSSSQNQNIYYRIVWLDASGNPIATGEPWTMTAVNGTSERSVSLSINNPSVSNYRIQVSLGRNF